ncbi:MAG: LCP family protein [Lachnospiraceae bacterium]|nr:LCP family protein [Lachnospiraceae bacterium]
MDAWRKAVECMKDKSIGDNKILNVIALVIAAIMNISAIILGIKVATMGVLPGQYLVGFAIIILLVDLVVWFTLKKKAMTVVMMLITASVAAITIYGFVAVLKVDSTIQKVTSGSNEYIRLSMVVRGDSPIDGLTSLYGANVGYIDGDIHALGILEQAKQEVMLGEIIGYPEAVKLAEALMNGSVDVILLNNEYIEIVDEFEDFEEFSLSVKIVYSVEIEIDPNANPVQVGVGLAEPTEDTDVTTIGDSSTVDIESKEYTDDSIVIYISGIDTWGSVSVRSRSDVNILAVINTKTGKMLMVNTPRDSYVSLVTKDGSMDKLTHAGLYGIECSETALENLYGVNIDYYVRLNFSGFEEIVDALGGIDVYSEQNFRVDDTFFVVGMNHLEGEDALRFARERYSFAGMGDVQRGRNQMEVIKAIIGKMTSFSMISNYTEVLDAVGDSVMTDMPTEEIYNLVKFQLATNTVWSFETYTVIGSGGSEETYSIPGVQSYVMLLDEEMIEEARNKMEEVLNE